jgi:hypothetical protein
MLCLPSKCDQYLAKNGCAKGQNAVGPLCHEPYGIFRRLCRRESSNERRSRSRLSRDSNRSPGFVICSFLAGVYDITSGRGCMNNCCIMTYLWTISFVFGPNALRGSITAAMSPSACSFAWSVGLCQSSVLVATARRRLRPSFTATPAGILARILLNAEAIVFEASDRFSVVCAAISDRGVYGGSTDNAEYRNWTSIRAILDMLAERGDG